MKHYIHSAFIYAILALIGGVYYREFAKINEFEGYTSLGLVHTHYFILGMVVFLLLLLLEYNFSFTTTKTTFILAIYHIGLNMLAGTFVARGIIQVLKITLSPGIDAMISGIAGLSHILLTIGLIWLLLQIRHSVTQGNKAKLDIL